MTNEDLEDEYNVAPRMAKGWLIAALISAIIWGFIIYLIYFL